MRKLSTYFLILFLSTTLSYAQLAPVDSVIEGNINSDVFLTKSKKYLLRGFVNVNEPATIHIEAGTVIYGEQSSKGTLIINRGAKINANGTAEQPIVFTSQQPVGQRGPGDWGGIIIAGKAPLNVPGGTATLEGGTNTTFGGGANPDVNDNSGVMRYVRLEFPGIAFLPDNEINGLTMGAVGAGTTLEYIQVSNSGDDAFEWFGGSVNAKYLISDNAVDDDLDVDLGFNGKVQFAFVLRNPNVADISGSNGWESDNDPTGSYNSPRTSPIFSNVTSVGPQSDTSVTVNPNYRRGAHIRRASTTSIFNTISMGWPIGMLIDGSSTVLAAQNDTMQIRNSIWAGLRANNSFLTTVGSFDVTAWYDNPSHGNRKYTQPSEVLLIDPFNLTNPNPVPQTNSPAASGASFAGKVSDPFFTPTTYVGAFDPNGNRWDASWANYDAQNTDYTTGVELTDASVPANFVLSQNFPNPFNPSTLISFQLAQSGNISLKVYDVLGIEVASIAEGFYTAGAYKVAFDGSNLSSGVYFYTLKTDFSLETKKMNLIK